MKKVISDERLQRMTSQIAASKQNLRQLRSEIILLRQQVEQAERNCASSTVKPAMDETCARKRSLTEEAM